MKSAIALYVLAMTVANLLVSELGPSFMPVIAFFLIGLDLALRDFLHEKMRPLQMLSMILVGGIITYALNPAAGIIAIASASAFTAAAIADWAVFSKMAGSWFKRSNASNVAGAAVDSLVFPTIAFGALMPQIVLMQFIAKVAGGAMWAWIINHRLRPAT